jgi:hypothetical protein
MATPFPFGSGNVLTAAQMNAITTLPSSTKTNSHTLTIADVGTRVIMNSASPTTITVNTSIFGASDVVEILNIGAGVCTVTAGTCTVSTSGTLALVQNAGGTLTFISASASVFSATGVAAAAGGLTLISRTTVTAEATKTISSAFTTTYNDYRIILTLNGSTDSNKLRMQLTTGGTPVTSGYAAGCFIGDYTSGTPPVINYGYAEAGNFVLGYIPNGSSQNANIQMDVFGPQATQKTAINGLATSVWSGAANAGGMVIGFLDSTTSYDGIKVFNSAGSNMTGTIAIYGYAKA